MDSYAIAKKKEIACTFLICMHALIHFVLFVTAFSDACTHGAYFTCLLRATSWLTGFFCARSSYNDNCFSKFSLYFFGMRVREYVFKSANVI